jgi:hypothetical protein
VSLRRASPDPAPPPARWSSPLIWLAFAALYTAIAVLMFWPLAANLRAGIPHDVGDPVLNTWILWWNAQAVPFTAAWWSAPAFWPLRDVLALSEHLAGLSPLSTPLQWAGAGPQLTYNVLLLLSWPLSAIAAHLLAHRLTGHHGAGAIAALIFGFNPYRLGQIAHLQVITCWWMPLALYALHRAIEPSRTAARLSWLSVFAAAWLLQTWTNGYFFFYFSVIVGLWWLWFARPSTVRTAFLVALAWMAGMLVAIPSLLKYREVHERWNLTRPYEVVLAHSADLASWASAQPLLLLWPFRPEVAPEQTLYPGVVAVALVLAGVVSALFNQGRWQGWRNRVVAALLILAGVFGAAALATLLLGGWELSLGPLSLTGRRARKPLTIALGLLVAAVLVEPRFRGAYRARSTFAFYTLAALVAWVMSFGPSGYLLGEALIERPPYWWLMLLPGLEGLRVPTRFAMVAALPLAVAAALAFVRLSSRLGSRGRLLAVVVCALAITADSWPRPLPMHDPRERFTVPEEARHAAVIELPLGEVVDWDVAAMSRGMFHQQPVVNGYSGHVPLPSAMLARALRERDRSILPALASFGPLCIVVDGRTAQAAPSRVLATAAGARLLGAEGDFTFYLLERTRPSAVISPVAVPILAVLAEGRPAPLLHDGREDAYWESTTWQRGQESLQLELTEPVEVRGLSLVLGARAGGYPRYLVVDTSEDGVEWTTAWGGQTGGLAFIGAVHEPARVPIDLAFATPRRARLIRLRQTGIALGTYWSVAEIQVFR